MSENQARRGPRAAPLPVCAQPERLVRLLLCQTRTPIPQIAEVLGFEDGEEFANWCERVTGHGPDDLREQAAAVARRKLEMRHLRLALLSAFDGEETVRLISALDSPA